MTALTDRKTPFTTRSATGQAYPVESGDTTYPGGLQGLLNGRARPWQAATGEVLLGYSEDGDSKTGDASGTVDTEVNLESTVIEAQAITGLTAATQVGDQVYAGDDAGTYTLTPNGGGVVGEVARYRSSAVGDVLLYSYAARRAGGLVKLLGSVIADSADVENTTTETAFDKTVVFDGALLKVGDVLDFEAVAEVSDNNSTDTLTLRLKISDGSNTVTIAASLAVDVVDADVGHLKGRLTVRAVGASGSVAGLGEASLDAPAADVAIAKTIVTPATLDTTGSLTVSVTAEWSVAHADNEVNLQDLVVSHRRAA